MNTITEAMLIDYLAGELEEGRRAEVSAVLGKDPVLYAELLELEGLMNEISGEVEAEPSAAADARFVAMVNGFQAAANENEGLRLNAATNEKEGANENEGLRLNAATNENEGANENEGLRSNAATNENEGANENEGLRSNAATNENEGLRSNAAHSSSTPRHGRRPSGATGKVRSLAWKVAGIAAAITLVFTAGRFYEGGANTEAEQQLVAHRTLVTEMMELMKSDRTSNRIRATTVTFDLPETDPVTTANLGYLLRNDENANVRLAALEALRRFSHDAGVREELLAAMNESPPPVVRFELIETLVGMNEKRVIPYLEDLMNTDSLPRPVRDAAQMASFKLI